MSEENVEVVRRWIGAFPNDPEAFRETLHPETVWFPFEENHTPSHGLDGAMRIRSQWLSSFDEMQAELEEVIEGEEDVVASVHVTAKGKTSGAEVDVRLHLHFKVREGMVIYLFEYVDRTEALEAVGLRG